MPTCEDCHGATIAVAHTASAVRDLGFAGVVSIAAASALGTAAGFIDVQAHRLPLAPFHLLVTGRTPTE